MIVTEDLSKKFDEFLAVDRVNLNVKPGQVLALLGPNGAGKTTTVRMLTSILVPSSGRAWVNGFDVVTQSDQVRASVGVLTEHHGLYGRMNADEYLKFYADLYRIAPAEYKKRADELLTTFGIAEARRRRLGEYSKGMRQKLALVRALIHNPPVLLLDEPTSAMDPESARMVRDAILSLRSDWRTIVLCTHNLSEAETLADQIAIIRRGKIILYDQLDHLKTALLGPAVFEAQFANSVDGLTISLPGDVEEISRGTHWIRFQVQNPEKTNPQLLRGLLDQSLEILAFQEIRHSLEDAYMEAVRNGTGDSHV